MEFAEYRQPWETGPHWELKREFLEFYKDNFTEERLLCLAQAYSNIELLHCSYPAQVMLQIHELSKPLQGCKRFRGNGNAQSNHQDVGKQQGKRKNNENASSQKFKFIKFCSGSDDSAKQEANEPECEPLVPTFSSIDYDLITRAENLNSFKKLSEEVKKLENSEDNAYGILLSAALHSNIEDLIDIKFTKRTVPGISSSSDWYYCELFIGTTKIATGHGENRYVAKTKASENALYILTHFKEPDKKSFEVVRINPLSKSNDCGAAPGKAAQKTSSSPSQSVSFSQSDSNTSSKSKDGKEALMKLALEVKEREIFNLSHPLILIHNCAVRLKMIDDVVYNVSKDRDCDLKDLYLCDLFFKNTLIGQGEGSKIKAARMEATLNGIKYLTNLAASNSSVNSGETSKKSETSGYKGFHRRPTLQKEIPKDRKESTPGNCVLNEELLNNSYKMQLVLYDRSEELGSGLYPTASLSFSAQMCRKSYCYNYVDNDDGTFRAEVLLDQKVYGTAVGHSKQIAKNEAAKNAFGNLQKQVYTVKVKTGVEDGYPVNREDMLRLKCDTSQAVSEDNIGRRMLKMMGWSGGGIGKMQGIAEPICAGNHNFGAGLGYTDLSGKMDMKNLKSEIDILLQEYSKSDEITPLVFSMDFTKLERKEIHRIAQKYHLFNNSQGKGDNRRLIIKRKVTVGELLDLIVKAGGSTNRYELVDMSK